jgi:hypothetical protein
LKQVDLERDGFWQVFELLESAFLQERVTGGSIPKTHDKLRGSFRGRTSVVG